MRNLDRLMWRGAGFARPGRSSVARHRYVGSPQRWLAQARRYVQCRVEATCARISNSYPHA